MLKGFRKEIDYCTYCPKLCRFACPVAAAEGRETSSPWGRQTLLYLVDAGRMEMTADLAETLYHCAYCMLCREYCDHDIAVPPVMREGRRLAMEAGLAPEHILRFRNTFLERLNPFGDRLDKRVQDLVSDKYLNEDAQVIYWPGCSAIYSFPQHITDTIRIFEALGIDYVGVWHDELQCCGEPLDSLGLERDQKDYIARLHKKLRKYKQIISGCPACVYNLRVRFAELGYPLTDKIFHITEFLAPFFHRGEVPLGRLFDQPVIYHDPCYLGRYLDIYDQPREILGAVCSEPVREFHWNHKGSYCCGGGGGIPVSARDTASAIATERLREYHEGDRKVLVTACASCERQFRKAGEDVWTMDIVNVVAKALAD